MNDFGHSSHIPNIALQLRNNIADPNNMANHGQTKSYKIFNLLPEHFDSIIIIDTIFRASQR